LTAALATAESTSKYADLNGFRLHYHDVGEGPVLLMLHGGGPGASAWSNFKQNVPALSERFRLLMVDQPGFGLSDKPAHDRPLHELTAELLVALLDQLGIDKATPVGNSMGGGASLELAIDYRERVDRLILMAPAGGSLQITSQLTAEVKILLTYYAAPGPSIERTKALFQALAYDASGVPEETLRERYEASIDPEAMAYNTRMFSQWATLGPAHWRRVNEIQHETLLLWGREDLVLTLDSSLHMLHQIPNARLVVFPKCGHWCQLEAARQFEHQIINFMAETA
jgi:4,5:9,10-diseco-3-hydroxy-5,9,17-trioxoandrosta-1(10),2-diene-4-oate hydrolase